VGKYGFDFWAVISLGYGPVVNPWRCESPGVENVPVSLCPSVLFGVETALPVPVAKDGRTIGIMGVNVISE
jgi:hypothetical protein